MPVPHDLFNRRNFLKAAALGSTLPVATGMLTSPVQAEEKAADPASSFMKLSLAAYSFNRYLPNSWRGTPKPDARMNLEDFIKFCGEQKLDAAELTAYYFPEKVTEEYLVSLKQLTFRHGLDISGTAIGNDFCVPDETKLQAELDRAKQWIDYSAIMGAPVIRIFAGKVAKGDSEAAAIERCANTINQALDYAAKKGVFLALENHGGITATPAQMFKIIEQVNPSPWFGINLDGGNFRTDDPYRDLEQIAPLAINAQTKVAVAPNGTKEPADLERVVGILKQAGYRGYLVLEYEESEDPKKAIPPLLNRLRELIA